MAVQASVLILTDEPQKVTALAAAAASGEIILGFNRLVAVNATADTWIRVGRAGMVAPTAADFRIPANSTFTFEMGGQFDRVRFFNNTAAAEDIYIEPLSKF
jgi:hypothetical protein